MKDESERYSVAKAYTHLKKARRLLKESGELNYKTEGSFNALMNYCGDIILMHKHRNQHEGPGITEKS